VEVRLLGPVEVHVAGEVVDTGQPRQRCVLAALAVDAGRPVTAETLVERVWGEQPPRQAHTSLYAYLARIRKLLGSADPGGATRLLRGAGGYVLDIDADLVDVHRFRRLVRRAGEPGCRPPQRVTLFREAVGLWQGPPLANVPGDWAARTRESWHREHLDAVIAWTQVEQAGRVLGPLTALVEQNPLDEALIAALMRVLHAAGRTAEALDRYAGTRERLDRELGADPGSELQRLHQAILRGDRTQVTPPPPAVPAQLPGDVHGFTGRRDELARLDALLDAAPGPPAPVVISALSGTAGIGKTALAVHWSHRIRDRFPDGQLYVNLRGFDPTGSTMAPAEALRRFLDALDIPPQRRPTDLEALAALYRAQVAGRRMLIVLDNARDAGQVRPLLPGTPECLVLVTSRDELTDLTTRSLLLDLFTVDEARDLLTRRLGNARVAAEPDAVDDIVGLCARLPLALAVVAGNAASQPGLPLAVLADQLRDARQRLDALSTGDVPSTDLRAVFSWSYRTLSDQGARLFRLLGMHPGPDTSGAAAASLAAVPVERVWTLLGELTAANLITEHTPGRYTFHDLLRVYASEQAFRHDSDTQRHEAVDRLLDHYVHTATVADQLLNEHRRPVPLAAAQPSVTPERLTDHQQALTWFAAEHAVLIAAIEQATTGWYAHVWHLAWTFCDYLDRRGLWRDKADTQHKALDAARRMGDLTAQAHAHRELALAYRRMGRRTDAWTHFEQGRELYARIGDRVGEGHALLDLAEALGVQARQAEAIGYAQSAFDLYRSAGHQIGCAHALNDIAYYRTELGDHENALTACEQALTEFQQLGHRYGQAHTSDTLGYIHHHLGHHDRAVDWYRQALDLYGALGDRYYAAVTLTRLGDAYHAAGRSDAAHDAYLEALNTLDDLGHPDAEPLRAKVHSLDRAAPEDPHRDRDVEHVVPA
jgi:DNA-binding SARP family transcriptional activator/tetratricopeptide (TPR) repeat protein